MTENEASAQEGGSSGSQMSELAQDSLELIRLELDLARAETIEKLAPAARSSGMIIGGGVLAAFGSRYLADAVVEALATRMPRWLAAFVFGTGLTAGGMALVHRGSSDIRSIDLVPRKTFENLRKDKQWLIDQIKSRLI